MAKDGGMTERPGGPAERRRGEIDEERWLVETMEAGRGKECEMSSGPFPREAAALAVAD